MQFRTKIVDFAVALASGAALCATLTLILARGIDRGLESVTLAEEQLALYLTMETNVSDMLRLYITAAAAPSDAYLSRLRETKDAVQRDVEMIRGIVADEVEFRGEGELEELERLDRIEVVLRDIERILDELAFDVRGPLPVDALAEPLTRAVEALDERLAPLIDLSIADDAGEVLEARAEIAALSRRSVWIGTIAGLLTLVTAAVGVFALLNTFMRPFGSILEGATRLARGELDYRIPEGGRDEFGRLSRDFNVMAVQLERSDRALRAEEEELQRRVAARTAELEDANARLSAQDATRRRFLADVSHELRTPLTVMRGEAEVALRLSAETLDEGARAALGGVVEQSEHMSRLVDDLLFVARREAGEAPLNLSRVRLGPLLERTVTDARQLAEGVEIGLVADAAAKGTEIEVDPGRVHQLLMVLLDNAIRYSPDRETITVEARRAAGSVEIDVRDRGIGIPAADLPHVLDRFVRGSNALPGGTGLGLPVAQAIAQAHGGALSIASGEGNGTTVTLTLSRPVDPEDGGPA
ncbi:sensor histidine kinase [Jannaschia marina]|uniref:sensor histidine kinase n=1 Tax=Jannaschia marina TaxID=2741674 RepID=UPI0015CD852F|nr:sensor histidine kinase [Jannaschia marina]